MTGDRSMMGSGWTGTGGMARLDLDRHVVAAGTISIVVHNVGGAPHELVVLPLANGQQIGARPLQADGTVAEAASLGEASRTDGPVGGQR